MYLMSIFLCEHFLADLVWCAYNLQFPLKQVYISFCFLLFLHIMFSAYIHVPLVIYNPLLPAAAKHCGGHPLQLPICCPKEEHLGTTITLPQGYSQQRESRPPHTRVRIALPYIHWNRI